MKKSTICKGVLILAYAGLVSIIYEDVQTKRYHMAWNEGFGAGFDVGKAVYNTDLKVEES